MNEWRNAQPLQVASIFVSINELHPDSWSCKVRRAANVARVKDSMAFLEGSMHVGDIGWRLHEVLDYDIVVTRAESPNRAIGITHEILGLVVWCTGTSRSGNPGAQRGVQRSL